MSAKTTTQKPKRKKSTMSRLPAYPAATISWPRKIDQYGRSMCRLGHGSAQASSREASLTADSDWCSSVAEMTKSWFFAHRPHEEQFALPQL